MAEIKINMDSLKTFKKAVRHKIKEGDTILRMLPPFSDASNGYPYCRWSISWGLIDPSTGNRRPYADCKPEEGRSPIWEYLDLLREKIEVLKTELKTEGMTEKDLTERFKLTNRYISDMKPKTCYIYNAVDKSGVAGLVELKTTAHKQVMKLMNRYILDYNQDPTSLGSDPKDSGVWMKISRSGSSFDTEYTVAKNQVMIRDPNTGVPSYQDDRSALPESIIQDINSASYDLTTLYQKKSYDELREILVANLSLLAKDNSDLYIKEFCDDSLMVVDTTSTLPKGSGKINLKLEEPQDDPAEDETHNPSFYKGKGGQAETIVGSDDGDQEKLMRMAEEIFNQ